MEKELFQQTPKISAEIKQTAKGILYLGSLKVNADSIDELDSLIEQALNRIKERIASSNAPPQEKKDSPKAEEIYLDSSERELFEQLRRLRFEISEKENFPPYVVFHDSVLKQFAKLKPRTKEEMLKINGVGEKRFEKYGELFLDTINSFIKWALASD